VSSPLDILAGWPDVAAAGVGLRTRGLVEAAGPDRQPFPWASVTKLLTALAVWIAVEEGTVAWDDPVGPPGATVAHLLAHASGVAPDNDTVLAAPASRRIYSNRGFELLAEHLVDRAQMPFDDYVEAAITEPLGLVATSVDGSPAAGASGPLVDLMKLGSELLSPTLVSIETAALATSVAFPGLSGVLPGFGRQEPNDWGLGVEIRDDKNPHWTGRRNSPRTFGHFGQSGSFLWIDPVAGLVLGFLGPRPFGPWAAEAWPVLSDGVIGVYSDART
jgi:CubicO group peptidase (beta-lactamase class C family)